MSHTDGGSAVENGGAGVVSLEVVHEAVVVEHVSRVVLHGLQGTPVGGGAHVGLVVELLVRERRLARVERGDVAPADRRPREAELVVQEPVDARDGHLADLVRCTPRTHE